MSAPPKMKKTGLGPVRHCTGSPSCPNPININDPHSTCIKHNTTCFPAFEYDPRNCEHCLKIINGAKENVHDLALFTERITAMRRSIRYALKSKRSNFSPELRHRYETLGINKQYIFAEGARHLDPRPRISRSRSSSIIPSDSEENCTQSTAKDDLLATAVNTTVLEGGEPPNLDPIPLVGEHLPDLPPPFSPINLEFHNVPPPATSASPPPQRKRSRSHFSDSNDSSEDETTRELRLRLQEARSAKKARREAVARPRPAAPAPTQSSTNNQILAALQTIRSDISKISTRLSAVENRAPQPLTREPSPEHAAHDWSEAEECLEDEVDPLDEELYHEDLPSFEQEDDDPLLSPSPVPEEHDAFFYWPDEAIFYDEEVVFQEHCINYGHFDFDHAGGYDTFRPIAWSPAIRALVLASSRVIVKSEESESRTKHHATFSKVTNTELYKHLHIKPAASPAFHYHCDKISRFLVAIKEPRNRIPFKAPPMTIGLSPDYENPPAIVEFAAAPKLSRECHIIKGVLSSATCAVPEALRTRDFEARQHLLSLIFMHETLQFHLDVTKLDTSREPTIKNLERIGGSALTPTCQGAILNALQMALTVRKEVRTKALSTMKLENAKACLADADLMCAELFEPTSIANARDCFKLQPPVVHIHNTTRNTTSYNSSQTTSRRGFPSRPFRGGFRGRAPSRARGSYSLRGNHRLPATSQYRPHTTNYSQQRASSSGGTRRPFRGGQRGKRPATTQ